MATTTTFEIHTVCDNCGQVIKRERVDEATFTALVEYSDPAVEEQDYEDRTLVEEGDLISEEEERPVEIFIRHRPVCSHCEGSP